MSTTRRCMIVPDARVVQTRDIAATLAPVSGAGMWTTPCGPTAEGPITHWITEGPIGVGFAALMESPALLHGACQQAGRTETLAECTAILTDCDVSEEDPHTALSRLGLVLVQEPM